MKSYNNAISHQHKIRGVDKQVCTAEQMLAYNFAFSRKDVMKKMYEKCQTGINVSEVEIIFVQDCIKTFKNTKYNLDAIVHIVRKNMKKYAEMEGCGIFASYDEIGKTFACDYEIK